MSKFDYTFSVLLLGDRHTGKKELCSMSSTTVLSENLQIGMDFYSKNVLSQGKIIKLFIQDFVGEERFKLLLPQYSRSLSGVILMYDITNSNTLKQLPELLIITLYNDNS